MNEHNRYFDEWFINFFFPKLKKILPYKEHFIQDSIIVSNSPYYSALRENFAHSWKPNFFLQTLHQSSISHTCRTLSIVEPKYENIWTVTDETDNSQHKFWISYSIFKPSWTFLEQGKKKENFVWMLYRTKWPHFVHSFESVKKCKAQGCG